VKAQAIQWAVYGLVMSFMLKGSNTAHIGGAIAGFLVGLAVGPDEPTRERDRLVQGVLAWCCIAIVVVSLLLMALDVPHVPIRWE
jgi:hypothetical protein